nr:Plasmodium exported protein (hyp15), unknown function [Plasmodium sp. DRC-Itaito]
MNFCSFYFLFTVTLSVLLATKENIHKRDLYKNNNKKSSSNFHKNISRVKCATKEKVYHEISQNDISYENFAKYDKGENNKYLDKWINDKKYSRNILNNKNCKDIFESVKRGESCDYKNNVVSKCNVIPSSNSLMNKTSRMTRFKNKLYKMIFKRNKFWRVISRIITVLGESAIICKFIMGLKCILKCCLCSCACACSCVCSAVCSCCASSCASSCCCVTLGTLSTVSGGIFGAIILLIILIIVIVWLLVTWLWSHKDVYYETHEE